MGDAILFSDVEPPSPPATCISLQYCWPSMLLAGNAELQPDIVIPRGEGRGEQLRETESCAARATTQLRAALEALDDNTPREGALAAGAAAGPARS